MFPVINSTLRGRYTEFDVIPDAIKTINISGLAWADVAEISYFLKNERYLFVELFDGQSVKSFRVHYLAKNPSGDSEFKSYANKWGIDPFVLASVVVGNAPYEDIRIQP